MSSPTTAVPAAGTTVRPGAALPGAGLLALTAGVLLILLLQILPPTNEISPIRRTISEYALSSNKWIFDVAVLLVALGSVVAFGTLIRRGLLPARSAATVFGALWTLSLLVIVAFPKHNWALGPSTGGGTAHRIASLVGFIALPLAVLFAARVAFRTTAGWRRLAQALAALSLGWFGLILVAVGISLAGGGAWWQIIPLGLVERLLAFTEVLAVAALAVPLLRRERLDGGARAR